LRRYFHIVRTATERLDRRLTQPARDGRTLDIRPALTSFTTDVTSALSHLLMVLGERLDFNTTPLLEDEVDTAPLTVRERLSARGNGSQLVERLADQSRQV
jgi:hypothetical protein